MCTVSIIPAPPGYRVVCNRDESRGRPEAAPPRWRRLKAAPGRALWPTDTHAGGTWIASSSAGLTLCLLNLNPDNPLDLSLVPGLVSRGLVIPTLIEQPDAPSAARAVSRLALSRFAPFRLVAIDLPDSGSPRAIEAAWDRRALQVTEHPPGPACFVSSGLGDRLVRCRLDLFRELVLEGGASAESQDRFHNHRWDDRPALSVLMAREDARTVSISTVEYDPADTPAPLRMSYSPVPEPETVPASA